MAKIIYRDRKKSVILSHVEAFLLFAAEFGFTMLDAFFPAKYPETWWTRRLLGLDDVSRSSFRVARHRLIRQGLVAKKSDGSYAVTRQGRSAVMKLFSAFRSRKRRPVWDGKWRLLVFDVPEVKKRYRDSLRLMLVQAGYARLQDSVWIGKYPLPEKVIGFIEVCNLDRHIYIFLSDTVDKEEDIRSLFDIEKS